MFLHGPSVSKTQFVHLISGSVVVTVVVVLVVVVFLQSRVSFGHALAASLGLDGG